MHTRFDVAIAGTGPAGMLAAAACGAAGLRVACLAPVPHAAWGPVYGVWVDDVADAELAGAMAAVWSRVSVQTHRTEYVQGLYGRVDRARWQAILRDRCEATGVTFLTGRLDRVEHGADGSRVIGPDTDVTARVVVQATGSPEGASLFQVAWGEVIEGDLGQDMRWMEFGDDGSFLYAMPDGERVFVEETSLATRVIDLDGLRDRLHARLAKLGLSGGSVGVERCVIALDAPVPGPDRLVRFGSNAGMVNPSTGYLLARLVEAAPVLAASLAANVEGRVEAAGPAAWNALWPASRRAQRLLHIAGAQVVARLSPSQLKTFFAAFFRLPAGTRRAWLADHLGPVELASAMARMPFLVEV